MDLYELTRKLVRRGCPDHRSLFWHRSAYSHNRDAWHYFPDAALVDRRIECAPAKCPVSDDDALAIWTCWALEWWLGLSPTHSATYWVSKRGIPSHWIVHHADGRGASPNSPTILEAIEAATRHLEPTNGTV